MIYLDVDELLYIARRTLGAVEVRDLGLLASAAARPQASAFGADAYPSLLEKAAALVHSLARSHPLVDGNKRLALTSLLSFLGVNGLRSTMTNDEAYELIVAIASGELDDVPTIAARLAAVTQPATRTRQ